MFEIVSYDISSLKNYPVELALNQFIRDTYASITRLREDSLSIHFDLGTAITLYLAMPHDCKILRIYSVIQGALADAKETITFYNHADTALTGGVITIGYSDSAAGHVDSCKPTANHTFSAGEHLKIVIGGENSNAVRCDLTILYKIG